MRRSISLLMCLSALVVLMVAAVSVAAVFQEPGKPALPGASQPAQLTPHHENMKQMVGAWDTVLQFSFFPGAPPMNSKGTATVTLGPGGLWAIGDFKADMGGMPFTGHSIDGFDPTKNKHTSVWVDNMSPALGLGEGTCENGCRKQAGWINGVGMDGKPAKFRYTAEAKDDDHVTFEMFTTGPDGKEFKTLTMTYIRRKA